MEEIWKFWKETNNNFSGHRVYEVSDQGNVKINGVLIEFDEKQRYYAIGGFRVHRAVAELFIPNPENKPCVDHINTNKHDNRAINLRWVTHKENNNNPLTRQHQSETRSNPEYKQKQSEAQKATWNSSELRQKQSESHKGKHRVYNDPNDHTAGYHYEKNIV